MIWVWVCGRKDIWHYNGLKKHRSGVLLWNDWQNSKMAVMKALKALVVFVPFCFVTVCSLVVAAVALSCSAHKCNIEIPALWQLLCSRILCSFNTRKDCCVVFRIMIVARKFAAPGKRKMHFAVSDADDFRAELQDLGISYVNDTPAVIARDSSEKRYVMQKMLTYVAKLCLLLSSLRVYRIQCICVTSVNWESRLFSCTLYLNNKHGKFGTL